MKHDSHLKNKVHTYIDKHYAVDEFLIRTIDGSTPELLNCHSLYKEVTDIFGLEPNYGYLLTLEWLYDNNMEDIEENWVRWIPERTGHVTFTNGGRFRAPGVYIQEHDMSQVQLIQPDHSMMCFTGSSISHSSYTLSGTTSLHSFTTNHTGNNDSEINYSNSNEDGLSIYGRSKALEIANIAGRSNP